MLRVKRGGFTGKIFSNRLLPKPEACFSTRMTAGSSSIGTKVAVALTGLALILFLVLHLAGNALVLGGPTAFNAYSHALVSNVLLVPAELGLAVVFLAHVYKAGRLWIANRRAVPVAYVKKEWAGRPSRKSLASVTMIGTGLLTFVFVVLHLKTFKYGPHYTVSGSEQRDLYRLVLEVFRRPVYVAFYVFSMTLIGFHLWHGFSSAFESLGVHHPRHTPRLLLLGRVLAVAIAGGFLVIPLWVYLVAGRS